MEGAVSAQKVLQGCETKLRRGKEENIVSPNKGSDEDPSKNFNFVQGNECNFANTWFVVSKTFISFSVKQFVRTEEALQKRWPPQGIKKRGATNLSFELNVKGCVGRRWQQPF